MAPRVRRSLALAALACRLATGCVDVLRFELPRPGEHASALLALEHAGALELKAFDLTGSIDEPLAFDPREPSVVTALYYRETLHGLGIEAGAVERAAPGSPSRPLPAADAIYRRTLGESAGDWLEVEEGGETIRAFELPTPAAVCPRFESTLTPVLTQALYLDLYVALDDERMLAGVDGNLYLATAERFSEAFLADPVLSTSLGLHASDGQVYLVDRAAGVLKRAVVETRDGATVLETTALTAGDEAAKSPSDWDDSRPGEPLEIILVTGSGRVLRWTGDAPSWSPVADLDLSESDCNFRRIARVGPGEAIVTGCWQFVRHVRAGQATVDTAPPAARSWRFTSVADVPGFGVVVAGASDGKLGFFVLDPATDAWSEPTGYAQAGLNSNGVIFDLRPYRDGYYAAGSNVGVITFDPVEGFCPVYDQRGDQNLLVGRSIVVVSPPLILSKPELSLNWFYRVE